MGIVQKVLSYEESFCPKCKETLKPVGSRIRVLYLVDGKKTRIRIRRLYCERCRQIHHEFPDMVVPYKRYDISSVYHIISGLKMEVGCDEKTAEHILRWWIRISKYARSIKSMADFKKSIKEIDPLLLKDKRR